MHIRSSDRGQSVKITREIPLTWLIGLAIGVAMQAALMWLGQEKQADAISRMSLQLVEQSKQINELAVQIGSKNLKDVEHDLKIADHERRLVTIETITRR